ncbi:hypothetical protein BC828DRAFT_131681 [Blastocladiella britannica]|nr:hypothetical protein BC828DRAFT_131681 [Blastocladiella britannica]
MCICQMSNANNIRILLFFPIYIYIWRKRMENADNNNSNGCQKCGSLAAVLARVRLDYDYNLSLIAARDAELEKWDQREQWWRTRWKDAAHEADRVQAELVAARSALAVLGHRDDDGPALEPVPAPAVPVTVTAAIPPSPPPTAHGDEDDDTDNGKATAHHEEEADVRATVRDLKVREGQHYMASDQPDSSLKKAQLVALQRHAESQAASLTAQSQTHRALDADLRAAHRTLATRTAELAAAESAAAAARDAEVRARADRDALANELAGSRADLAAATAAKRGAARELAKFARQVRDLAAAYEAADRDRVRAIADRNTTADDAERAVARAAADRDLARADADRMRAEVSAARADAAATTREMANEARARDKQLAVAEARVMVLMEEVQRRRDAPPPVAPPPVIVAPPPPTMQQHLASSSSEMHGDNNNTWEQEALALRDENDELAGIVRGMRDEMERVAREHATELSQAEAAVRAASARVEELQMRAEAAERRTRDTELDLAAMRDRATALRQQQPPPPSALWQGSEWQQAHMPPTTMWPPPPPVQAPPPQHAAASDEAVAAITRQALQYHAQAADLHARLRQAVADRERVLDASNSVRAELVRATAKVAALEAAARLRVAVAAAGVQTDPVVIATIARGTTARTNAAVALAGSKKTKKEAIVVGAGAAPTTTGAKTAAPRQQQLEAEKKDALLRLRKMGLRNWNDNRDDAAAGE